MTISNLNSLAFITSMLVVVTLYLHDARLEYVTDTDRKTNSSVKSVSGENELDDSVLMSTGRHIHIESTTMPGSTASYNTSLASSQPRTRDNEDKIAINKLITNAFGNNSDL